MSNYDSDESNFNNLTGKLKMSEMKTTVKGMLLGGSVWELKEGKKKFNACVVLEDGEEGKVHEIRDAALKEEFGDDVPKGLQDWTVNKGDDEEYEHSFGKYFINPKSKKSFPKKVRRAGKVVDIDEDDDLIYPGANVAISISAYAYKGDKKENIKPGVTLNVRAVMFLEHGQRLGDSVDDEEFDNFESSETDTNAGSDDEDWG